MDPEDVARAIADLDLRVQAYAAAGMVVVRDFRSYGPLTGRVRPGRWVSLSLTEAARLYDVDLAEPSPPGPRPRQSKPGVP